MKRSHLNLLLLVVVIALAVAVYFSQKKEEKGPPLTALTAETVNRIVIAHPGAPVITLAKQGTQWKLLEPVRTAADPFEVGNLLNLATLEVHSTLDAGVKTADVGLDPPAYSVTLNDQKLEFGGLQPLNNQRYIRLNGKIVLVDDPPPEAMDSNYSELVGKQLIAEGGDVTAISLPGLSIAKSADGKEWTLNPANPAVTSDQKQKFVDAWKNARAMWNAAEPAEGSKGDEVSITLKDRTLRFVVVSRDPQLVLARPDLKVQYTLSKALEKDLLKLEPETKDQKPPAPPPQTKS